jgi:galactokinase
MSLLPPIPVAVLASAANRRLREMTGRSATHTAAAPGRVNLIGEHIDYCDGFVLPFALDRCVVIAAVATGAPRIRLWSAAGEPAEIDLERPVERATPSWANYVRGVVRGFQDRGLGVRGFDAAVVSSVPIGAGLSSSAALECATATLLEPLVGTTLDPRDKALLCQRAEHDFAGVPCGIMDQFSSTFGQPDRLVLIDCRSGESTLVPFTDPGLTVVVANTRVHHDLADGDYACRRRDTERGLELLGRASWRDVTMEEVEAAWERLGHPVQRRCRHVVGEIARTVAAARALESGAIEQLGGLMAASHDSLRDDFEVSCRELDILVDIARDIGRSGGVIGARMTGGGFGGSTVTLCESGRAEEIAVVLRERYRGVTGIDPEIFASRPSAGGRLLDR